MNRLTLCLIALVLWVACPVPVSAVITNVVETGGDNEAVDTITAKWTGQTWAVTQNNEPVPGLVVGNNYTAGSFGHFAPAFVDRNHRYSDDAANNLPIPSYLVDAEYIMSGNDNRDNNTAPLLYQLDVTIDAPASVYMLIDNRMEVAPTNNADPPHFDATHMQWILDQGWAATANGLNRAHNAATPDEVAIDESADGTINQWFSVYRKDFPAGTFSLFQANNSGQNMYGVVLVETPVVPEPGTLALAALGLAAVVACGRARGTLRRRGG